MASDFSRKRKHSGSEIAATSPARYRSQALEPAASGFANDDLQPADSPDIPGALGDIGRATSSYTNVSPDIPRALGDIGHATRRYTNVSTRDQARAHYGDHYGDVYHNVSGSSAETAEEAKHRQFAKSLSFDRMDFRRATIDPAYGGTCQWIFDKERFLKWRDPAFRSSNHGMLWIKGKPGSGKSTLMKCILEHLQYDEPGCTVISFFFNARGGRLEKSTEGCYRSLLHQMLEHIPTLRNSLRIPSVPPEDQAWEIAVVRDKLREAVLHLRHESLIMIIDALDECKLEEVRDMVDFLCSLTASTRLQTPKFNICLASRHYPNITIRSCESLVVENENAHSEDVHEYVHNNLHIEPGTRRQSLVDKVMQKSQGVFMWVIN